MHVCDSRNQDGHTSRETESGGRAAPVEPAGLVIISTHTEPRARSWRPSVCTAAVPVTFPPPPSRNNQRWQSWWPDAWRCQWL